MGRLLTARLIAGTALAFMFTATGLAQMKWTVPKLRDLNWKADQIGSGRTKLSQSEIKAVKLATAHAIGFCVKDPGPWDPHTAAALFASLRVQRVILAPNQRGVLVQGTGVCMCGATGNCDFWLKAEKPGGLHVVLQTIGIQTFEIRRTSSHGYFDVILGQHDSAWETDLSLYHFTGSYYRRAACAVMSYQGDHFQALKVPTIAPVSCQRR